MAYGCEKDDTYSDEPTGSEDIVDDESSINFTFSKDLASISEAISSLKLHLTSHESGDYYNFDALLEHLEEYKISFTPGDAVTLKDGDYTMRLQISLDGLKSDDDFENDDDEDLEYNLLFYVTLESSEVVDITVTTSADYYSENITSGDGTEDNPFLIKSKSDFNYLKFGLYNDPTSAAGLYFKQTNDFDSPGASDTVDGTYLSCYAFAGTYDGDGHTISDIQYNGGGSETSNIGLFSKLLDGAVVKDLSLDIAYNDGWDNMGGLAGKATGNVTITNVDVSGYISGARNTVGGIIGYAKSCTNLNISGCNIGLRIDATKNVGGMIGAMSNSQLTVDGFSNTILLSTKLLYLQASDCSVGGVIGTAYDGSSVDMKNVVIKNTITEELKTTRYIQAGTTNCGGLIGVLDDNAASVLENITILSPVYAAGNYAGGLIGYASLSSSLTLNNCMYGSYVSGDECVGGFMGYADGCSNLVFGSGNNISMVNSGYLAVEGANNVGALIGSATGDLTLDNQVDINVNVTGSETNIGGCVGIYNSGTLDLTHYKASNAMRIEGQTSVGGIVGYLQSGANVEGLISSGISSKINSLGAIPSASTYSSKTVFAGTVTANNSFGGGIIGYMKGGDSKLSRLAFTGTVIGKGDNGSYGGLVGYIESGGDITGSVNIADTIACIGVNDANIGGIVGGIGTYASEMSYCINYGNIKPGNSSGAVGGIIGYIGKVESGSTIQFDNLINAAETVEASGSVGGIVGSFGSTGGYGQFSEVVNYSYVYSPSGTYIGGIVGNGMVSHLAFLNCSNHSDVYGADAEYAGGICGFIGESGGISNGDDNLKIQYCCNKGEIKSGKSSSEDGYVGGIAGMAGEGSSHSDDEWGIYDCYNSGDIPSNHKDDTGGILGTAKDYVHVKRCVNTGTVSHGNGGVGTDNAAITYLECIYIESGSGGDWQALAIPSTYKANKLFFIGLDFTSTWVIDTDSDMNNGYPYLQDCKYQAMALE